MNTKQIVKSFLKEKSFLRDDDERLSTHIWFKELELLGIDPYNTPITEFLRKYADKKLTLAPTIVRVRRKLQVDNIFLRGKKYYKRQGEYQNKWRKNLGYE
tara:strand:+ start:248 stop:550 length:303 start_codon:yes stop_codon:yes gene_type:complete